MKKVALNVSLLAASVLLLSQTAFAADSGKGKELISSLGCKGCHKLEGAGGSFGPALDGVGARMSEAQLRQKLLDPKANNPQSAMPAYKHLPEADLQILVEALKNLK